jgi:antitoxin PrlF
MNVMFSKVTSKSQTVIPRAVREKLGLKPGDRLAYALTDKGIIIQKAKAGTEDDPFAVFSEWASAADDEAYAEL